MGEQEHIDLDDIVSIKISGEVGRVTGIAFYLKSAPQFRIHYKDAHGCAQEKWFEESSLQVAKKADAETH